MMIIMVMLMLMMMIMIMIMMIVMMIMMIIVVIMMIIGVKVDDDDLVWLVGFLTSSSTTRLYRGRAPRQSV